MTKLIPTVPPSTDSRSACTKRTIESICIHLGIWHQLAWTKAKLEALYDCMRKYTQHLVSLIRNIGYIETFFTSSHFDKLESFFSVKSLFRERSTKNHIPKKCHLPRSATPPWRRASSSSLRSCSSLKYLANDLLKNLTILTWTWFLMTNWHLKNNDKIDATLFLLAIWSSSSEGREARVWVKKYDHPLTYFQK